MANAEQLIARKGDKVVTLPPNATALEAAIRMTELHIGSVLVIDDDLIVGIFTERDVLRRIVAGRRDAATTAVSEVMSSPVLCATPHTLVDELRDVMRERRIRHVPVVDGARLVGIVSIGNLNRAERQVQERTIEYLTQFVTPM